MRTALVGSTGFVGGNLAASYAFDGLYHSADIKQAYGTQPDILVYAGVPAAKYLANASPEQDFAVMQAAVHNISQISPVKTVLISTVDVYPSPCGVTERDNADLQNPAAYGRNRAWLEQAVRRQCPDALIVRLPALFGLGLKKNFLFDFLTRIPAMLKPEKYTQLAQQSALVAQSYQLADNGFYKLLPCSAQQRAALRAWFESSSFSALSFTDSRSEFQFYNLQWLWRDINTALQAGLTLLNITSQPVSAAEIYAMLTGGQTFTNHLSAPPARYDMRSCHDALFGGRDGYLYSRAQILDAVCSFAAAWEGGVR